MMMGASLDTRASNNKLLTKRRSKNQLDEHIVSTAIYMSQGQITKSYPQHCMPSSISKFSLSNNQFVCHLSRSSHKWVLLAFFQSFSHLVPHQRRNVFPSRFSPFPLASSTMFLSLLIIHTSTTHPIELINFLCLV